MLRFDRSGWLEGRDSTFTTSVRTDSVPKPAALAPNATIAASPPEEPPIAPSQLRLSVYHPRVLAICTHPAVNDRSYGFFVCPKRLLMVSEYMIAMGSVVLAMMMAPARSKIVTIGEVVCATSFARLM